MNIVKPSTPIVCLATTVVSIVCLQASAIAQSARDARKAATRQRTIEQLAGDMNDAAKKGDQAAIKEILAKADRMRVDLRHLVRHKISDDFSYSNFNHRRDDDQSEVFGNFHNNTNANYRWVKMLVVLQDGSVTDRKTFYVQNLPALSEHPFLVSTQLPKPQVQKFEIQEVMPGELQDPKFDFRMDMVTEKRTVTTGAGLRDMKFSVLENTIANVSGKQWKSAKFSLALYDANDRLYHVVKPLIGDFLPNTLFKFELYAAHPARFELSFEGGVETK